MSNLKWLLISAGVLLILCMLLTFIMLLKITVLLNITYKEGKDRTEVILKALGGIITYKKEFSMAAQNNENGQPGMKSEEKKENTESTEGDSNAAKQPDDKDFSNSLADMKMLINHISGLFEHIKSLLKKVSVRQFEWYTGIGTGDAASTGMFSGAVWALMGSAAGIASHYMRLEAKPILAVTPFFQRRILQMQFNCMFQVRMGNAILAGIKMIKHWKGGVPRFRTKPVSSLSPDKANTVS